MEQLLARCRELEQQIIDEREGTHDLVRVYRRELMQREQLKVGRVVAEDSEGTFHVLNIKGVYHDQVQVEVPQLERIRELEAALARHVELFESLHDQISRQLCEHRPEGSWEPDDRALAGGSEGGGASLEGPPKPTATPEEAPSPSPWLCECGHRNTTFRVSCGKCGMSHEAWQPEPSPPTAEELARTCILSMGGLTPDMYGFDETVAQVACAIRAAEAAAAERREDKVWEMAMQRVRPVCDVCFMLLRAERDRRRQG
jgi:hypothetical protein